jgi:hypothetical protein
MIRVERPSTVSPRDSANFTIDLNIPSSIGVNIGVWRLVAVGARLVHCNSTIIAGR